MEPDTLISAQPPPVVLPRGRAHRSHGRGQRGSVYRGNNRGGHGHVGDESGTGQLNREAVLALRPATILPQGPAQSSSRSSSEQVATESPPPHRVRPARERVRDAGGLRLAEDEGHQSPAVRGQHGSRRSRGGRGVPTPIGHQISTTTGRLFGGHLSSEADSGTAGLSGHTPSSLHADAPDFQPGQSHQQRPRTGRPMPARGNHHPSPRLRRGSSLKSTAPDIATRTHEDIDNGLYECPICTSEVGRRSKIWSCKTCWTVFHLTCVKKWAQNEGSTLAQQRQADEELPPPRQWRCPGCNLPKDTVPTTYACWCGKDLDPPAITGLPPHSCGQTCGRERILPKKCPHPCELVCHAGPCPPCTHTGPTQICFCGKSSSSRRCLDTDYNSGWSCGSTCGDLMPCGKHTCSRPCHEGLCGACVVELPARCYCGRVEKRMFCSEIDDEKYSRKGVINESGERVEEDWIGNFDCGGECGRMFDCGKHSCEQRCHPQAFESSHCPRSPDTVTRCSCGKTALKELCKTPRKSCEDPIPNCSKLCLKQLACGHSCQVNCHSGLCMPCPMKVDISCRCGRTTISTVCYQSSEKQPLCMRTCKANLNCGRHECGERCCPWERKAAERLAAKRKLRPLGSATRMIDEEFEAEHICLKICGRTLKCGTHTCLELCHKGPCGTCREAIFDEISCNCGRTTLQPPLPCGTSPPSCRFPCERAKPCGHPRVMHNCHGDDELCPNCPFLLEKACMCGKKILKNQPCFLADVRCGEVCGRKLRCGSHFCQKTCHRPGECEDAGRACSQQCGQAKKACGHPDEELCHAPSACREDKLCQSKIFVTCDCQNLKTETKCLASKDSEGNRKKSLKCDDECARLERNRRLALALNIDPATHKDDHIPYSTITLQSYQDAPKWAQTQEREFRVFAADETERRLRFKPMPKHQRSFIHSLAEDFGLDNESMDPEPHRHVFVFKTPRFVMAPMKTIGECVRIRHAANEQAVQQSVELRKLQENNTAFNGFLLSQPRFGLTVDEVRADIAPVLDTAPLLTFDISFLPSEEIVLKAHLASSTGNASMLESSIRALKPSLATIMTARSLAGSVTLCALDTSLNILRLESDPAATSAGWSQVAAKVAVGPRVAPRISAVGAKSSFTVLGSKGRRKREEQQKKENDDEPVVEDWEEEVRREEEEQESLAKEKKGQIESPANQTEAQMESSDALNTDVAETSAGKDKGPAETADIYGADAVPVEGTDRSVEALAEPAASDHEY